MLFFFRDAFHHLQNQKIALLYCFKKLNNGGRIIIQDFNPESFLTKLIFLFEWFCFEHPHPIKLEQLQQNCEKIGFISRSIKLNSQDYLYIGKKRIR